VARVLELRRFRKNKSIYFAKEPGTHNTCRTQPLKKVPSSNENGGRPWTGQGVPNLLHVIQSYDTAFSAKESADYSAITNVGNFSTCRG
jgi:hypothetical protein